MRTLLLQLAGLGKTLIVTSHILPELSRICDQVAIISHGRLRTWGPLTQIMKQVRQQRLIEIQLSAPDQVSQTVKCLRGSLEAEAQVEPSATEAIVRFETQRDEAGLQKILASLIREGIPVSQCREVPTDLEDAFLSVTGTPSDKDLSTNT
jgi:ABC-2 type transport system ATP-binding protein